MRPPVAALVLVVLLSGCSALFAPTSPAESTSTLSPAPAPTPEASYPPGVREDSVAVFGLLDAHATELSTRSYTVVETRTLRDLNGSVRVSVTERNRIATDDRYHYTRTVGGREGPRFVGRATRLEVYSNGSVAARRLVAPNGSAADSVFRSNETVAQGLVRNPDGAPEHPNAVLHGTPRNVDWLGSLVARATFRVEPDGDRYRLIAAGVDGETLVVAGRQVENVTVGGLYLVVTETGLVEHARFEYQGTVDGSVVTGVETVSYEAVGTTRVREPRWFDTASNQFRTWCEPPRARWPVASRGLIRRLC